MQARKVLQWVRNQQDVENELAMHAAEACLSLSGPMLPAPELLLELADTEHCGSHTVLRPQPLVDQPPVHDNLSPNSLRQSNNVAQTGSNGSENLLTGSLSGSHYPRSSLQHEAAVAMVPEQGTADAAQAAQGGLRLATAANGQQNSAQLPDSAGLSAGHSRDELPRRGQTSCVLGTLSNSGLSQEDHAHRQSRVLKQVHDNVLQHAGSFPDSRQLGMAAALRKCQLQVLYSAPDSRAQSPTAGDACLIRPDCSMNQGQEPVASNLKPDDASQHVQQRVAWHTILARRNFPQLLLPAACTFFQIWSGERCFIGQLPPDGFAHQLKSASRHTYNARQAV